ncbi:MAG: glycosyltransferase family 39 protein [Vicinamibacterales bacterium]
MLPTAPEFSAARRTLVSHHAERWLVVGVVALLLAGATGRALSKPLWHDELFTYYIARIDSLPALWTALSAGTDLNPPLYYLAVRACAALIGEGPVATRLPAIVGFVWMTIMLFVFVRRRLPARFALIGALTPSLTGVYTYAFEGRPYGLVLGLAGVALVAWQRSAVRGWIAPCICAAALAAATSTHYYGLLTIVPLAAGELTRIAQRRRIDLPMCLALACGVLPLLFLRPLIAAGRAFAPTFWSRPSLGQLMGSYQLLFDPLSQLALAAVILAGLFTFAVGQRLESAPSATTEARGLVPLDELVVGSGFIALPVVGFAMSVLATGGFHERYVVAGVIGVAGLFCWGCATTLRSGSTTLILAALLLLAFTARQLEGVRAGFQGSSAAALKHISETAALPAGELVVISHAVPYLQLAYFRDLARGPAVTYLTKPADVVAATGDTGSRALRLLSRYAPLDIRTFEAVAQPGARFYVYGPRSWLVPKLLSQGAAVTLVREEGDASLFMVSVAR